MKVNATTSGWRTARSRNKLGIEVSAQEVPITDKTPPPFSLKACVGSSAVAVDFAYLSSRSSSAVAIQLPNASP
jgi:hypothetical protein